MPWLQLREEGKREERERESEKGRERKRKSEKGRGGIREGRKMTRERERAGRGTEIADR